MSEKLVFWRDGYSTGRGGAFVRGASLNKVITQWAAEGVHVAGIVIDPEHEANVECIIAQPAQERDG
jgi:hypothetical protein